MSGFRGTQRFIPHDLHARRLAGERFVRRGDIARMLAEQPGKVMKKGSLPMSR